MKTLKLTVIALMIAFTTVSATYADGIKEKPKFKVGVCIALKDAIKIPGLVRAMYHQVSQQEVIDSHSHTYTTEVNYDGKVYRISGTLDDWMSFFLMDGNRPINTKVRGHKLL